MTAPAPHHRHLEEVELTGHIIDSLILPKVLDEIASLGGRHHVEEIEVGQRREDPSRARLRIEADSAEVLEQILARIVRHGAVPVHVRDAQLQPADLPGCFPENFHCTTNERTEVRQHGKWIAVARQKMDAGIRVAPDRTQAECVLLADVQPGDLIVVGRQGVRVSPVPRDRHQSRAFAFMGSSVSSEKPKHVLVREIAEAMHAARAGEGKILVVAGPAVVHTG